MPYWMFCINKTYMQSTKRTNKHYTRILRLTCIKLPPLDVEIYIHCIADLIMAQVVQWGQLLNLHRQRNLLVESLNGPQSPQHTIMLQAKRIWKLWRYMGRVQPVLSHEGGRNLVWTLKWIAANLGSAAGLHEEVEQSVDSRKKESVPRSSSTTTATQAGVDWEKELAEVGVCLTGCVFHNDEIM